MKIGRNNPCWCNSGKKYKKCHYLLETSTLVENTSITKIESNPDLEKIRAKIEFEQITKRKKLEAFGIYIDFVTPIQFKGKKVWALGSRVYANEPSNQTFHEFIIDVLRQELGQEWWNYQISLPDDRQHFIIKCFKKHYEWRQRNESSENKVGDLWAAKPDGYSRALLSLAFDVCSLIHAVHLPEIFLSKLREYKDYQGVRYEIAIAALFARMSYKITFLDEKYAGQKLQPKHCEFIASDPVTNEKIAVEVKSKTRKGVLHRLGEFNKEREFQSSVAKLYRHALEQNPGGKPFTIFLDMNLPFSENQKPEDNVWLNSVTKMRDKAAFTTKGKPSLTNAIIFTNFSYHYGTDKETGNGEWLLELPPLVRFPIKSMNFANKLMMALSAYGNVPNLDLSPK